tara:strand:+ start:1263 stop:1850 length:588 start_codon:yes stop_codon:yes gene_type:complete
MAKKVPVVLKPLTKDIVVGLEPRLPEGSAFFILKKHTLDGQLSVFGSPSEIRTDTKYGSDFQLCPRGSRRFEWYVRRQVKRGDDLWASFAEQLIMLELRNRQNHVYETHCGQATSLRSTGVNYNDSYLLDTRESGKIREAFYFGAGEMLRLGQCGEFSEQEVEKLAQFLYEDFKTKKYSDKSMRIGLEADSVFFS